MREDLEATEPASRTPARQAQLTERPRRMHDGHMHGVQPLHPALGAVDNCAGGVQQVHPAAATGCKQRPNEVQPAQARGAAAAREPYEGPSSDPPAAPAGACDVPSGDRELPDGRVDEFFGALGSAWRLTAAQRDRLAPAVGAALRAGWTPAGLAEVTGANTSGVRNRYAVLAARLSPAELPEPPTSVPQRPPWCGQCDQRTRRREDSDGADAGRCPVCHPLAGTAHSERAAIARMPAGRAEPEHGGLRTAMMLSELMRMTGRGPGWARG